VTTLSIERLAFVVRQVLVGLGVVLAAMYWWQLTVDGGLPVDLRLYWGADPNNLYPHPELLNMNGYDYSPAFELVVGWGRLLPLAVFAAVWRAILLAALVWLAGPFTVFVLFLYPVASEINAGNIQFLMAAAIVLGFRWPATWSFVLLTKITPGVGILWFAFRREWRKLAIAVGATAVIALVTFVAWPDRWFSYIHFLTSGVPAPVWPYYSSIWERLPIAIALVALGAWRGWRWTVPAAATIALPLFYLMSPAMFVGVLPYAREALGRWLKRRWHAPETLREQAPREPGAILAG
jgi:hypothetical protein